MEKTDNISREEMVRLLNEDLAREFQAVIAYVVYSQTMKGAAYQAIAGELKKHAAEELNHAILIAKQIDYLNGTPVTVPKPVALPVRNKCRPTRLSSTSSSSRSSFTSATAIARNTMRWGG